MVKKYEVISNDIRQKFIELVENTENSIKAVSITLGIKYGTAKSIFAVYKDKRRAIKSKNLGKPASKNILPVRNLVERFISENPQITLKKLQHKVKEAMGNGFDISISTINRCLGEIGITTKVPHRELDRVNQPKNIEKRKVYSLWYNSLDIDQQKNIIFIDESSFNLYLRRNTARSKKTQEQMCFYQQLEVGL